MSVNRSRVLSLALAIAAAGLLYGAISGYSRFTNDRGGTDFNVFYSAGRTVLDGNASALYSVYTERGPGFTYIYLPMFAVLMAPLSFLPIAIGSIIWNLLSLSMVFHSALILYRGCFPAASRDGSLRYPFLIFLVAASVVFLAENLLLGQVHIVLMYLIVLAWKYQRTRMEMGGWLFHRCCRRVEAAPRGIRSLLPAQGTVPRACLDVRDGAPARRRCARDRDRIRHEPKSRERVL